MPLSMFRAHLTESPNLIGGRGALQLTHRPPDPMPTWGALTIAGIGFALTCVITCVTCVTCFDPRYMTADSKMKKHRSDRST